MVDVGKILHLLTFDKVILGLTSKKNLEFRSLNQPRTPNKAALALSSFPFGP